MSLPLSADLERAAAFTREPFLADGEDPGASLAPGTPRRRALDAALAEMEAGLDRPSVLWRRQWSLLLGLERILGQDEPALVDGTVLSAHQVDALSGTLTALLAEAQRNGAHGEDGGAGDVVLASAAIPGEAELPEDLQEDEPDEEPQDWADEVAEADDAEVVPDAPEDPNAAKRFWFEHATGAGKTVAALGFVEASRTGGTLILTHRRNLVDQFNGELRDRGYAERISPPLLGDEDSGDGPVTVETYQWFVRNAGRISDAYAIVICDEAHTALGEKTSAAIRGWAGPVFVGMTATGALIARHVTDLFPTQTSRFDLAQAARRGVIAPLRCVRIPPGPGVRTIAKVPLRRGEVDTEFDQELLAELLDQLPFNLAVADLYKSRFEGVPGVVYAAGVRHAYNVAEAFRDVGMKAQAVSGETPKRELAQILADYERGEIDVLVNAQLLAEGWNSPRATVCMHLAPTASRRIYQQRVGRVTRRQPGKEAGIVIDFVHPATKHDDPVVTLHSLLDRDVYRGGAIVVGPVRRGRGRRLRVERRVMPVTADPDRRIEVFERELWRIAVEYLDWGEQIQWAALAGARVAPNGWRRARAMLHFDQEGELKRAFLLMAAERNKNPQLRLRALQEITALKDPDALTRGLELIKGWPREEKREGVKIVLLALAEKKIGRRDQANNWIWDCAEMTRELHEEYAVQRWPETKRLLGLLVNSSGGAHARNARRLVHAARTLDRRLSAALLAAAIPHTAEAGEVINGARTRMSRKPAALARDLLRNFPKAGGGKSKRGSRRRKKKGGEGQVEALTPVGVIAEGVVSDDDLELDDDGTFDVDLGTALAAGDEEPAAVGEGPEEVVPQDEAPEAAPVPKPKRSRRRRVSVDPEASPAPQAPAAAADAEEAPKPKRTRRRRAAAAEEAPGVEVVAAEAHAVEAPVAPTSPPEAGAVTQEAEEAPKPRRTRRRRARASEEEPSVAEAPVVEAPVEEAAPEAARVAEVAEVAAEEMPKPKRTRRRRATAGAEESAGVEAPVAEARPAEAPPEPVARAAVQAREVGREAEEAPKPKRTRRRRTLTHAEDEAGVEASTASSQTAALEPEPKRPRRRKATAAQEAQVERATDAAPDAAETAPKPARRRRAAQVDAAAESNGTPAQAPKPARRARSAKAAAQDADVATEPTPKPARRRAPKAAAAQTNGEAPREDSEAPPKPARRRRAPKAEADGGPVEETAPERRRAPAAGDPTSDAADQAA